MKILFTICSVLLFLVGCKDNKQELVMATNAAFAPFEYVEGKEFKGIDVEIAQKIANELGVELKIKDMDFDSVVQAVVSGSANIALSGLTVNEVRKKVVNFSKPYFVASQMVIALENDKRFQNLKTKEDVVKAIKNAKGLRIGVQSGTTGHFYSIGDAGWGFEGFKDAKVMAYKNSTMAIAALLNNQIDIIIFDEMPAKALVATNKGSKVIDISLTEEEYAIAVKKGDEELLNKIDTILQKMKDDRTLKTIIEKYYK